MQLPNANPNLHVQIFDRTNFHLIQWKSKKKVQFHLEKSLANLITQT